VSGAEALPGAPRARLVLASASPRRRELLSRLGLEPDCIDPPAIDESPRRGERPRELALRLAEAKLAAILPRHPGAFVLAADTVVAAGRRILPKAESREAARAALSLLSGRRHRVWSGVVLAAPDGRRARRVVGSIVAFARLTPAEIETYLASGEWEGKAGGYAIQGRAEGFVRFLSGSYSNVVGLPLFETRQLLKGLGWPGPL
jgi:septum formation protein